MRNETITNPGELSHLLILQRPVFISDTLGGQNEMWETVQNIWAKVSVRSQREREEGAHLIAELTYDVSIRYRDGVTPGMRFLHKEKTLSILSCADLSGRRCFLSCLCREVK